MKTTRLRRASVLSALFVLGLAACGSDAANTSSSSTPVDSSVTTDVSTSSDPHTTDPHTTDMDHSEMDMNMGDADATPADDVVGAALARGDYALMDTRPDGYDDVAGTAVIARSPRGTTVTTEITGLKPNAEYISHIHAKACDVDNAGDHYQFEIGGSKLPPNEIHLAFTSDQDGNGFMTAENVQIAGADAVTFVVHPKDFIDNKIACVAFVEDEPGSTEAAISAGVDHSDMDSDMDHD